MVPSSRKPFFSKMRRLAWLLVPAGLLVIGLPYYAPPILEQIEPGIDHNWGADEVAGGLVDGVYRAR